MNRHQIIYTSGGGRTCDQLLTLAQFVAFCAEFEGEFEVIDVPFWPYSGGFQAFVGDRCGGVLGLPGASALRVSLRILERCTRFANSGKTLPRRAVRRMRAEIFRRCESLANGSRRFGLWVGDTRAGSYEYCSPERRRDMLCLDDPDVVTDLRSRAVTLICGPKVRCWSLVKKHREFVRRTLELRSDIVVPAAALVAQLRQRYDFLIAVHLRQTDYREYHQGRFYFSTGQYVEWMKQALDEFSDRGRVGFLVASDQPQDPAAFAGLPFAFSTATQGDGGHYLEDLAALGLCDLVIATASSFAFWGAFRGGLSVIPMLQSGQQLKIDDAVSNIWDCIEHPVLQLPIW